MRRTDSRMPTAPPVQLSATMWRSIHVPSVTITAIIMAVSISMGRPKYSQLVRPVSCCPLKYRRKSMVKHTG